VVSKEDAAGDPQGSFRLILETRKATNLAQLQALEGQDLLQGTIVNDVQSLDGRAQQRLREGYRQTDFSKCLILEHGRSPKSPLVWGAFVVVGALSAISLVGLVFYRLVARKKV
jgi:hypothetical protein